MSLQLPPDFWQYLVSALLLLLTQYLAARFGIKLPVLTPPVPPGPAPSPEPKRPEALLPGGGILALLLRLLPLLLASKAKGEMSPEDREALRLLRQALPEEKAP